MCAVADPRSPIPDPRDPFPGSLLHRLARDFLGGGDAVLHLEEAAVAEGDHSLLDALLADVEGRRTDENELTQRVGDLEDLIQTYATFVAGLVAGVATGAPHGDDRGGLVGGETDVDEGLWRQRMRHLALAAHAAHEAM